MRTLPPASRKSLRPNLPTTAHAEDVERAATWAGTRCEGEREAKATKKQHAEAWASVLNKAASESEWATKGAGKKFPLQDEATSPQTRLVGFSVGTWTVHVDALIDGLNCWRLTPNYHGTEHDSRPLGGVRRPSSMCQPNFPSLLLNPKPPMTNGSEVDALACASGATLHRHSKCGFCLHEVGSLPLRAILSANRS